VRFFRFTGSSLKYGSYGLIAILLCILTGCGTAEKAQAVSTAAQVAVLSGHGCGAPFTPPPATSVNATLLSGGLSRQYRLHIPHTYRSTIKYPLVLSFHGHSGNALMQERISGLSTLAEQKNFVVAYPQGTIGPDHLRGWDTGPRNYPHVDDVRFVNDLIGHLEKTLCIDPHRIYATGFSNGGSLTNILACKLANRIAAVAIVSGGMHPVAGGCTPQRPISLLEFHGTGDHIVPYKGNSANDQEPPIRTWLSQWVERDGCQPAPTPFFKQGNVLGEQWTSCRVHAVVMHYCITGGQHTWPKGSFVDEQGQRYASATDLIWHFLQAHSLTMPT
jgi:polyhydroxybutyrate depolymerase